MKKQRIPHLSIRLMALLLLLGGILVLGGRLTLSAHLVDRLARQGTHLSAVLLPEISAALAAERYADLQDYLNNHHLAAEVVGGLRVRNRYGLTVAQWGDPVQHGLPVVSVSIPKQLGSMELTLNSKENQRLLDLFTGYLATAVVLLALGNLFIFRLALRRNPATEFSTNLDPPVIPGPADAPAPAGEPTNVLQQAETYRRHSQRLLQVFETIPHPFFVIDVSNYHIVLSNSAFKKRFPGKALTCYELIHQKSSPSGDNTSLCCPIKEVKKKRRSVVVEQLLTTLDGSQQFVELCARPLLNRKGELTQIAVYSMDITDRKKAQDAVEEALAKTQEMALQQELQNSLMQKQKQKLEKAYGELKMAQSQMLQKEKMASVGQLAAGVAHEINNPMGFISSNLVSLGKHAQRLDDFIQAQTEHFSTLPGADAARAAVAAKRKELKVDFVLNDLKELIGESLEGAERVKNIVQNLKSFSRIDSAEESRVNIHDCLDSTINIVWNEIKYKAELKRDYADLPMIKCFPQQLNQVFMNLLVNAAHAIEKNGEIVVRTWQQGGNIMVTVSDNGSGIDPKHMNRLFEPFFTTKEVGKGTGLGLSIAYDIVKKHKGEIRVASEVGKGTTFAVSLPINDQ